jgi:hypothetical protein
MMKNGAREGDVPSTQYTKSAGGHGTTDTQIQTAIHADRLAFLVSMLNQAAILANSEGGRGSRSKWNKRAISSAVFLDFGMTHRFTAEREKRGASIPAV